MFETQSAIWRKSTRSNNGGNCVEVATNLRDAGVVLVRDTKDQGAGPVLGFAPGAWAGFLAGVKNGEFDL